jgi:hypothetical protein
MVAEKTVQFQMMSIVDFGCNKDHPGSPQLARYPGGAHSPRTNEEATPLLHTDYEVMSLSSSSVLTVVLQLSVL